MLSFSKVLGARGGRGVGERKKNPHVQIDPVFVNGAKISLHCGLTQTALFHVNKVTGSVSYPFVFHTHILSPRAHSTPFPSKVLQGKSACLPITPESSSELPDFQTLSLQEGTLHKANRGLRSQETRIFESQKNN